MATARPSGCGAFGHRLLDHAERRVDRDNEIDWLLRILREANRAARRHRRHVWLRHPHNERLTKLEALADRVFRLVGLLERSDGALQLLGCILGLCCLRDLKRKHRTRDFAWLALINFTFLGLLLSAGHRRDRRGKQKG